MGLVKEFREFALKGNMVDMAVGIIIGAAFGGVVKSLVDNVLMPPLGVLIGGMDFSDFKVVLRDAVVEGDKVVRPAAEMQYGVFLTTFINFVIVSFAVFMLVKAMNTARKRFEKPVEPAAPALTKDQELLGEIRDLLKSGA